MSTLKKFDIKEKISIDPASTILVPASRRSGKTYYSLYLVDQIKDLYSLIIVFTHTKSSHQWDNIIDPEFILDKYDPDIVKKIFKRNEILKEKCPDINRNVLLIFDDILDSEGLRTDEYLQSLFTRGRWSNVGVIFLTQYLNAVPPIVRTNCDIIVVPIQTSLQSMNILHDSYGVIPKKDFFKLINIFTQNYNCFIIRNDKRSNDYKIKYQFDKAEF